MAREQLTFTKIEVTSLPEESQVLWAELIAAKAAFKASLQALAPAGKSVQFTDKYGELKIALATKAQPKASTATLADFLAAQSANGHAV